ncbi:MAG TPA: PilZ domain-containing protein [Terriglobales bacterium]|jgi:DNA-binding response OmpR family regulator|nr:PilZ domain-containing protein [Terriglobales bacterium]
MQDNDVMRLEGVLLTSDAQVLCVMNQVLDNFEIETEVCTESNSAVEAVSSRKLDTLIVDWSEHEQPAQVLSAMRQSQENAKSTVLVMVNGAPEMQAANRAGANFIMHKPINFEQATRCLRAAYGAMLQQRRRAARYPVDIPVTAKVTGTGKVEGKIADLSEGGLAFHSKQTIQVGQELSFELRLPGTSSLLHITAKVVNTDGRGRAGVCFTSVPAGEMAALKQWLSSRLARMMDRQVFTDYTNRLN